MKENRKISRRGFIGTAAATAASITVLPSNTISGLGHKAPSDKLNIAAVGIGSMGFGNLKHMETDNIVALCDVDWKYSAKVFDHFPNAKKYWDWRKMYDEMGKSFDAVLCATADHSHAGVTAHAITMGKHVYTQKPLTHSVYESRLLTRLAKKYNIASQMGNQGSSGEGVSLTCEWIWNGEIGEVRKIEAFTDRPIWPQGLNTPKETPPVPETLNWDLFIGPAKMRPYNPIYHPWNWRGWWDFGTGALGDMACHILHPVFMAMKLQYPTKAQGSSTLLLTDCAPNAQMVTLTFPARQKTNDIKINLPEVEVIWYDGGLKPTMPKGWPAGKNMNNAGGGSIFHGTKDTLICGCYGRDPWLLSGRVPKVPQVRRRIKGSVDGGAHEQDWIRACKENPASRVAPASDFKEAGPFNEMVVMGVLAVRLQGLNKILDWDGPNMKFTNLTDEEKVKICLEDNFTLVDGDPKFNKKWTEPVPAKDFAAELIKHTYRAPFTLPDMPA
jgi:predicted dehydrogenase